MKSTNIQFIIDDKGEKSAAVVPMKLYAKMLERLEELEDIELYDAVIARQESSISLEEYRSQRQKRKQTHALSHSNSSFYIVYNVFRHKITHKMYHRNHQ
jgi:hypothetical protein